MHHIWCRSHWERPEDGKCRSFQSKIHFASSVWQISVKEALLLAWLIGLGPVQKINIDPIETS